MRPEDITRVVDAWAAQYAELGREPDIRHVQIFENRGAMMGASNPHPHCQVWATEHIPDEPQAELLAQKEYRSAHGSCLLCDYLHRETELAQRIVCENEEFVALVPFWAVWPFETLVLSRTHAGAFDRDVRRAARGPRGHTEAPDDPLRQSFRNQFPYTMGLHQTPTDGDLIRSGIFTRIFILRCCAPRRCANSWWGLKCWACRSGISPRKMLPHGCEH